MSFLWFLLGGVVGGGVMWLVAARQSDQRVSEAEARVVMGLERARADAMDADQAHAETKARLLALQAEHDSLRRAAGAQPEAVPSALAAVPLPQASISGEASDLKRVKGIGPALERRLKALGVATLADLAGLSASDVERLNAKLDFPGRIQRERWIEQARTLLRR